MTPIYELLPLFPYVLESEPFVEVAIVNISPC